MDLRDRWRIWWLNMFFKMLLQLKYFEFFENILLISLINIYIEYKPSTKVITTIVCIALNEYFDFRNLNKRPFQNSYLTKITGNIVFILPYANDKTKNFQTKK